MLDSTPAPTRAEKALEMRLPQNKRAFLVVNSRLVYHLERMRRAPGRKAASIKPRKKRTTTMPVKLFTIPERVETSPHNSMEHPM